MKKILTRREKEVFDLLVSNYDTKEMAKRRQMSNRLIHTRSRKLQEKILLRKESMIKMRLYGYFQTVSCRVTVRTFEPGSSSLFFLTSGYLIY